MKKILWLLLIIPSIAFSADWKNYFENLTDEDVAKLEEGKDTSRERTDYKNGLELLPNGTDFHDDFLKDVEKYDPELCVEMLYVLDKPDVPEEEMMVYLLNNLRAFSDQKGLEYYSHNRGGMHLLYKDSYFVLNDRKTKTADPVVTVMPEYDKRHYYQRDTTFGGNVYSLVTKGSENTIWLQMKNTKSMTVFKVVKGLDKWGVSINFLIQKTEDKILVYSMAQIKEEPKIKKVFKWKVNIPGSFKRRMRTIVTWFEGRIK